MKAQRIFVTAAAALALIQVQAAAAASPDGSTLTVAQSQAGGTLVTNAGTWNFGGTSNPYGNAVLLNASATSGFATLLEVASGGKLYAEASDSSWWLWNSPGWSRTTAPTGGGQISPDGSTLTVTQSQSGGTLVTSAGTWNFSATSNPYGNAVLLNAAATAGYATLLEVASGGKLYAQAGDSSWWLWNSPGWSRTTAPAGGGQISPDGSTLTIPQSQAGHTLITSGGTWNFGTTSNVYGNAVLLNGGGTGGTAMLLEVANSGQMYAQAGDASWWRFTNPGWSRTTAPTTNVVITGVTFNGASNRRDAQGSDNWPAAWSNDDNQYAMWGDGGGFGGTDTVGRSSLGVARIEGDSGNYQGHNRYGGLNGECAATIEGKAHGAPLSIGGVLYVWITPGSGASGYDSFSLYKSIDYACTWTPIGVTFVRTTDGISFGSFVQFGKDNGAAIDTYVYIVAVAVSDTSSLTVVQRPGRVMLLRVPAVAASIESRAAYQFFAGPDAGGQPSWSSDPSRAVPVYTDTDGVGPFAQMSYVPGLNRLVYTNQHGNGSNTAGFQSLLTMAEAPAPWGPWTNFYRDLFLPASTLTIAQSQAGGTLVTSAGTWNFGTASNAYGHTVLLNGGGTGGYATLLAVASGQLYAQAGDGSWWRWNNPGWSSTPAPFEQTVFQWNFAPKWYSNGGRNFTLIFSGTNSNDSWNTISGTFITSP
jgi:hypothetical protein